MAETNMTPQSGGANETAPETPGESGSAPVPPAQPGPRPAKTVPPSGTSDSPSQPVAETAETAAPEGFNRAALLQQVNRASVVHLYMQERHVHGGVYVEGSVDGDIAGRDVHKTGERGKAGGRERTRVDVVQFPPRDQDKLRAVVARVVDHDRARAILDKHRVMILRGRSGAGKEAAAVTVLGLEKDILVVNPAVRVTDLVGFTEHFPYGDGRRYLVATLPADTANRLDAFVVRSLQRQLEERDSYLVITVDEAATLDAALADVVMPWHARPDVLAALRKHLVFHLGQEGAANLEERYEVAELIRDVEPRGLRGLDQTAHALVAAFECGEGMDGVRRRLGLDARSRLEEWFETQRSPEQLAFLLAAAVLSGRPYTVVDAQASRLERQIARLTRIDLSRHRIDPRRRRGRRLEQAFACLRHGLVDTEFGLCPADLVEMGDPGLRGELLRLIWFEDDVLGEAPPRWVRAGGADGDPMVRLQAAAAAGWLSQFDFSVVRDRLLFPWAKGTVREAFTAAEALGFAANFSESGTDGLTLRLLDVWSTEKGDDDVDRWYTAALAYGGGVGIRYPEVALPGLLRILVNEDLRSPRHVVVCVLSLLRASVDAAPAVAQSVLRHLREWLTLEDEPQWAARWVTVLALEAAADPGEERAGWFRQLLLDPLTTPSVHRLVRAALAHKRTTRDAALQCLHQLLADV